MTEQNQTPDTTVDYDTDDTEGHGRRDDDENTDDTEGHGRRQDEDDADDVEGHGRRG
jgi:hypothetical protein